MKSKSIDINQRIPLDALHVALQSYLGGEYDEQYILEQLHLDFTGENRIKKSLRIINKIILKNPLVPYVDQHKEEILNVLKRKDDRNLILIALLNASFPFSFDVLRTFGKYLAVQDLVNTETISKSISNVYGGNRATEIGLYSVIPMFIEANILHRPKQGLYEVNKQFHCTSSLSIDLYKESLKFNAELNSFIWDEYSEPYLIFSKNY
ncbi:hypothetical protein [Empedobacter sp. GD03739]|uniref:hypothetical protein n=1 Tax=Empedobacter sp. GD03739 TaxID=2975376 RepID=UPI002448A73F|nr:hypothetical protein [Empedobacter sp. GD03739]MDH1603516.1 hypothetical protein [Empedobacter sp. GD03739]